MNTNTHAHTSAHAHVHQSPNNSPVKRRPVVVLEETATGIGSDHAVAEQRVGAVVRCRGEPARLSVKAGVIGLAETGVPCPRAHQTGRKAHLITC